MNAESMDHHDPLFLVSRSLDDDLSAAESSALDAALAASAELRVEAAQIADAQGLVNRWSMSIPAIDTTGLNQRVMSAVHEEASHRELADVDAALRRWSQPVEFDDAAFTSGVLKKLQEERTRQRMRLVYRIGAPLAMAAAVALVVTSGLWFSPTPVVNVVIGPHSDSLSSADAVRDAGQAVVTFVRDPVEDRLVRRSAPMVSMVSVGSDALAGGEEFPPL